MALSIIRYRVDTPMDRGLEFRTTKPLLWAEQQVATCYGSPEGVLGL